ncbi:MAG TPA: hypothetical protein VKB59_05715 [Micromonosporaceae bacterium]|nr:hypothetical protein [Micromonosporaceae bacterium]
MAASPAEELSPTAPGRDARFARARAAVARGAHRDAMDELLDILRDRPDSGETLVALAVVANDAGRHASALQFADAALRVAPDDVSALTIRSTALTALDRLAEARDAAELAIAYDPRSVGGYDALAAAWLQEHSEEGYRQVLSCATEANGAVVGGGRHAVRLAGSYALALDALGARAESDAIFAALIALEPRNITLRALAADAAYRGRRWLRVIDRAGAITAISTRAKRRTRSLERACATAIAVGLVNLAGYGALLCGVGVMAQVSLPPTGAYLAVGVLAVYVGTVIAWVGPVAYARRRALALAARRAGPVAGVVLVAVVIAAQVVSVVNVHALSDGPAIWLSVLTAVAAMGALLETVEHAVTWVGWRHRARRHRAFVAAAVVARDAGAPPSTIHLYRVATSTPGMLALAALPSRATPGHADATPEMAEMAELAAGFDMIVATFATDPLGPRHPLRAPDVEVVDVPVTPGRPPNAPTIGAAVDAVAERLRSGACVAITCPTAAGASAIVAAAVGVRLGLDAPTALSKVALARGVALAIAPAQLAWLDTYAAGLRPAGTPAAM